MTRSRALLVVRYGLLVLILAAVGWALARNWDAVADELGRMGWGSVLLAFALTLGAPVFTLVGWRVLLTDLGTRLPMAPAASIFFVGQLGKYVPGSVWTVFAQAEMGAALRVPRRRMAVTGLLSIGLAILCGSLIGVVALPRLLARDASAVTGWLVGAALVLGAVLLWPPLLNRCVALGLRVLRREPLEHALGGRAILVTCAWFVGAWVSAGLGVAVLVRDLQPDASATDLVVVAVCGFALASAVGQLSVLVPAGVGVRDGVLALLLVTFMPLSAATAVVVVARFLTVVGDLVVAGGGWAWGRRHHLLGSRG
ncbi:lysylphosphatidylglycerol synthase domain-containing protein [uncultured Phycicoccus sp.]|uniref:lysylphosphatidylglycerol synthase domain-containing protein n=1 Tax=uncultured Phycicoccus sp. TaxID=661422 RepID=UPI002602543A|nr:lysylphosphatidylglycerol synthase domain-containing protein [uncultured Phycicoccus sp.]